MIHLLMLALAVVASPAQAACLSFEHKDFTYASCSDATYPIYAPKPYSNLQYNPKIQFGDFSVSATTPRITPYLTPFFATPSSTYIDTTKPQISPDGKVIVFPTENP